MCSKNKTEAYKNNKKAVWRKKKIWKQLTHLPEKSTKILNILNNIFDLGEIQKSNKIQKGWEKVIILDYVLQCSHLIAFFWFDWHTWVMLVKPVLYIW